MLLSGGVPTNIFRPKRVLGKDTERLLEVMITVDSPSQAEQAADFFRSLTEVDWVEIIAPPPTVNISDL